MFCIKPGSTHFHWRMLLAVNGFYPTTQAVLGFQNFYRQASFFKLIRNGQST